MLIDKNELKNNIVYEVYKKINTSKQKVFVYWYFENALSPEKDWVLVNFVKNERTHFKTKKEIMSFIQQIEEKESVIYHTKKKIFE
jgi:predicted DNA-binding protein YlxM (UPF0122 family)